MATKSLIRSPDLYVEKFRLLAEKIGPNFRYTDAVKAGIWTTHIGDKLQLSYNAMRKLAGLPLLRLGRHIGTESKKRAEYVPRVQPQKPKKGPLVNPCLGLDIVGVGCNKMLPKGQHFCPRCKARKDSIA